VAKDVCAVFGDSHYRRSVALLDADEKGVTPFENIGGAQKLTIVNEAGLYGLSEKYSIIVDLYTIKGLSPSINGVINTAI
jgi:hypothetical protein